MINISDEITYLKKTKTKFKISSFNYTEFMIPYNDHMIICSVYHMYIILTSVI